MTKTYSWVPTQAQELVLLAALSPPDEAFLNWKKLKSLYDIEKLDSGSNRLLPLLFNNLKEKVEDDELFSLLKGTQKKYFYKNNMLIRSFNKPFNELNRNGIDVTLLKGMHLISVYYTNMALRPMNDIDFLVSRDNAPRAWKILEKLGWSMVGDFRYPVFDESFMTTRKSVGFEDRTGYQCDIHWNLFSHRCFPEADGFLLDSRKTVEWNGMKFKVLCAEDLALLLLEHGSYSDKVPSIRWIPDLILVLNKEENFNWDRVLKNTVEMNLEIPVSELLNYLQKTFDLDKVSYPLKSLRSIPPSKASKKLYNSMMPARTVIGQKIREYLKFWSRYCVYVAEYKKEPAPKGVTGFIRFLKFRWGLKSNLLFPFVFFKKVTMKSLRFLFRKS